MIRVTVELIPFGNESSPHKRTLGTLEIANDASGSAMSGNYTGVLHAEYTSGDGRRGLVTGFHRHDQSVWSLVGAFLKLFGHTKHSPSKMEKV